LGRVLALSALILVAGCTSHGSVSGKVSYKGKTLPAGLVTFIPEAGKGHPFNAEIQEDGSYTVNKVPTGPVKILVKTTEPPKPPARTGPGGVGIHMGPPEGALPEGVKNPLADLKAEAAKYVKIPPKYADAEQSDLTYTVTSGAQNYDIELK
jgi:hypothetical protein